MVSGDETGGLPHLLHAIETGSVALSALRLPGGDSRRTREGHTAGQQL